MTQTIHSRHALAQANRTRQLAKFTPLTDAARLQLSTLLGHGARVVHASAEQVVLERADKRVSVDQHGRVNWTSVRRPAPSSRSRGNERRLSSRT